MSSALSGHLFCIYVVRTEYWNITSEKMVDNIPGDICEYALHTTYRKIGFKKALWISKNKRIKAKIKKDKIKCIQDFLTVNIF